MSQELRSCWPDDRRHSELSAQWLCGVKYKGRSRDIASPMRVELHSETRDDKSAEVNEQKQDRYWSSGDGRYLCEVSGKKKAV